MPKPIMRVHNSASGENLDREMTNEEYAKYQLDVEANAEKANQVTANAEAKAALLERLGITADEAALLLG